MRTRYRATLLWMAMTLAATAAGFTQPASAVTVTVQQLNLLQGSYTSPTVLNPIGLTFVPNASDTYGAGNLGTLQVAAVGPNEVHPTGTVTEAFFIGAEIPSYGSGDQVLNCTTLAWTGAGSLLAFTITRPGMINYASIPAWAMYAYDATGTLLSTTYEGDLTNGSYDLTNGQYADFTVSSSTPIARVVFCSHNGGSTYNALPLSEVTLTSSEGGTFAPTGSLNGDRAEHTATLLNNGKVLVAGGTSTSTTSTVTATAELYDPSSGTWASTGSLRQGRYGHTATLLPTGKVLVAGGFITSNGTATATAELYDPSLGTWAPTDSLHEARSSHTATLLPSGKVLVAGGTFDPRTDPFATATAELYDPSSGSWSYTGSLNVGHTLHTATLLTNGRVLLAGGADIWGERTATAELYNPSSGSWSLTGPLNVAHAKHAATLLTNGQVLVAGGGEYPGYAYAELYDPNLGTWARTDSLHEARFGHTATLLPNGQVLVTGGEVGGAPSASAELYDPSTGAWTLTDGMDKARASHTATLLKSGQVLLAGGYDDPVVPTARAELFLKYAFTGFFQPVDNLPTLNIAKAGSAIPVKFSLHGNQGLGILAGGSPGSQPISCSSTAPVDAIEQTVTASTSSLTYDATADQYLYVWKTDKSWAGTCRQLVVQLKDSSLHYAKFKLTK